MSQYPNGIDDNTTLPPATGDDATSVNANIAATEAIENELGILPAGVYATVRTRLDILEARINNPNAPAPNVINPFYVGNTGVSIQAGFGDPNLLKLPAISGSFYLREDGYNTQGLYMMRPDGYWHVVNINQTVQSLTRISLVSGSYITNSSTPVRIGGRDLDISSYPTYGMVIYFKALIETTSPSATCQIQLYDATNNVVVATGTTSSSTGIALFSSNPLTIGKSAGNIRTDMAPVYEVRLSMISGNPTTDYAICSNARFEIVYVTPLVDTVSFNSGSVITNSSTPVRVGATDFDISFYPATGRSIYFKALIETTSPSATCQIQLYDATNNAVVSTGTTSSYNGLVVFNSGILTVGTSPGNIRNDMVPIYEVRLSMTSGNPNSDVAICTDARLEIVYG